MKKSYNYKIERKDNKNGMNVRMKVHFRAPGM